MTLSGLALIAEIAERYNIPAVLPLLRACYSLEQERTVCIAVLGRFKAGKSSFLNHLLGQELLPVGVVPVTSVVTEIGYGPEEAARVQYLSGEWEEISVNSIHSYISESENPENLKQVSLVANDSPSRNGSRSMFCGHAWTRERLHAQYRDGPHMASTDRPGAGCDWRRSAALGAGCRAHTHSISIYAARSGSVDQVRYAYDARTRRGRSICERTVPAASESMSACVSALDPVRT